jgi:hypothetical protein
MDNELSLRLDNVAVASPWSRALDMSDDRTERLRVACRSKLEPLLREAEVQHAAVQQLLAPIENDADDFTHLYNMLEIASGQFPFVPYQNYYFQGLEQPTEPLFIGIQDALSERYFKMPTKQIEELRSTWVLPVSDAVKATFDKAKALYIRVASEAAIVRRLSGYEDLLKKLGDTIKVPWSVTPALSYGAYSRAFPYWVQTMTQAMPFHRELAATRRANQGTLRKTHGKLQGLIPILRSMLDELEFGDFLKHPVPMPQTLILISSIDQSTKVGDGSSIRDSAVGKAAQRQGR